ncbi:MAG TPA: outer membrane beta-barrel protein [Puia sp.]|nr:outer membrane beta-barrel protein [Puia sp.]
MQYSMYRDWVSWPTPGYQGQMCNLMFHYPVNVTNSGVKQLIFCALLFSFTTGFGQVSLEAIMGYNDVNLSNIGMLPFKNYEYNSGVSLQYSLINSFHVGLGTEIPIGKKIFLEPALLYFGNGSHISGQTYNPGPDWYLDVTIRLYYLHIPVNFIYKTNLFKAVQVFGGAGLYFSRGLWGKENGQLITKGGGISIQNVNNNTKFQNGVSTDWTNPTFNPYDLGYNVLVGIEWEKFQLTSSISNGLIKAYSGYNYNLWNSAFSVYLTYKFASIPKGKK